MSEMRWTDKLRLRSHFGFSKMPFAKGMQAARMFDSSSQRELLHALLMWTEILGFCLVIGPSGVGKSITLRRFGQQLDQGRFRVIEFSYMPTTDTGFLRSLCRKLGLPMRLHGSDLFDQAQAYLVSYQQDQGAHPVLFIDDGEGLKVSVIDLLRRLTCSDLDADDRFSIVLSGTDDLLRTLAHGALEPLRNRLSYVESLRPFALEDTRNYVRFHLERADAPPKLFSDQAVQKLFQASQGRPRNINQLATQALIRAAVHGRDEIDGEFMRTVIGAHPMYQSSSSGGR